MSHLFKVGEMVDLRSAPRHSNRPNGPCEVIACLPHESGPVLYRVQSLAERNERVVEEADLMPSAVEKSSSENEEPSGGLSIAVSRRRATT